MLVAADTAGSRRPWRFNSSIRRLRIPRASLPVKPFVNAVCPASCLSQSLAMKAAGAGFLARQECRSHLDGLCAESQGGDDAARISDAARGDHRHIDDVDDLRDERKRARERILRGAEE